MTVRMPILTCAALAMLTAAGHAQDHGIPEANPGRPTVSTPATLTPRGYLQFETGLLQAWDFADFSQRLSVVNVTKIAVHPRLLFSVGLEPYVRFSRDDPGRNAAGGTLVGTQVVMVDGGSERPTFSVGYSYSVFGGNAPDLDIGSARHSFTVLGTDEIGPVHVDANLMFNRQVGDDIDPAVQYGQTLSVAHEFGRWVLAAEVWHFTQPMLSGRSAGSLFCLSYAMRPNLLFDGGFNRGLTSTSTPWQAFAGFTYLLPHPLWRSAR
jgi:hypothetical protein